MQDKTVITGIIVTIIYFFIGMVTGIFMGVKHCQSAHKEPMDALGIERFQKCEINTTNCHSNWYEIVWKKEHHK